jgi:PilZ domain
MVSFCFHVESGEPKQPSNTFPPEAAAGMSSDKRKFPRKKINAVGFLYTAEGWPLGQCQIKDISTGGARVVHALSDEIPGEILLALSRDGKVRRRCEVRWRKEKELGVRFL